MGSNPAKYLNVKILLKYLKYLVVIKIFCMAWLIWKSCNITKYDYQFKVNNVKVLLTSFKAI